MGNDGGEGRGVINGYDFEYDVALDDLPALEALVDGAASLDFGVTTDFFKLGYDGTLKQAADAPFPNLLNGTFSASSDQMKILTQLAKDSLPVAALDLSAFEIAGAIDQDLTAAPETLFVDLSKFTAQTDYAEISFDGRAGMGAPPASQLGNEVLAEPVEPDDEDIRGCTGPDVERRGSIEHQTGTELVDVEEVEARACPPG